MGERLFKVCDHGGKKTCDERNTVPCVICNRDFCTQHRKNASIALYLDAKAFAKDIGIGVVCFTCMTALQSEPVRDLFRAITTEEIIRVAKAHMSAEALT